MTQAMKNLVGYVGKFMFIGNYRKHLAKMLLARIVGYLKIVNTSSR